MKAPEEKVTCRTPTPGRSGTTRIPKWKYDCIRAAILAGLKQGDIAFSDLAGVVRERLDRGQIEFIGSLGWHVTTVKLNMEAEGEIARVEAAGKQRLTLA